MFGKSVGLHIIKFPSNRFGYVGDMPTILAKEVEATKSDVLGGRSHRAANGNLMAWKFPSFETEKEARDFAKEKGAIISN